MIKYRLNFNFEKVNQDVDRDNAINVILSGVDQITSDFPIRKPLDGEVLILYGEKYIVISSTISFVKDDDITFYDINTLVVNKKSKDDELAKRKQEKLREGEYKSKMSDYRKSLMCDLRNQHTQDVGDYNFYYTL